MKNVRFLCLTSCLLLPMLQSNIAIATPKTKANATTSVASDNETNLWAEVEKDGSAEAYQVYLDEYPTGKYAALAKRRLKNPNDTPTKTPTITNSTVQKRPPRPELPVAVREEVWQGLEASDNYRYWPKLRATIRVSYRATERTDGDNPTSVSGEQEISPVGEKCLLQRSIERRSSGNANTSRRTYYSCNGVRLLDHTAANVGTSRLEMQQGEASNFKMDIEQYSQQGSLFPLRVGAEYSVQETRTMLSTTTSMQTKCRVTDKIPAQQLHPKLTGTAWKVICENSFQGDASSFNSTMEKHYLEDFGIYTIEIGVAVKSDGNHWKVVIPIAGQQIVMPFNNGRTTATYENYDLSIDPN